MASTTSSTKISTPESVTTSTAMRRQPGRQYVRFNGFRIMVYALLTLGALLFVMPFLWMVTTSLKTQGEIISKASFIPSNRLLSITPVSENDMHRPLQDFFDAGEIPPYLDDVRGQIEDSQLKRAMTLDEYMRTQRIGFASLNIDIGLLGIHEQYVVKGGVAHYVEAWDESNFSEYFFNSVQVAILTIFAQTVTSILAAYAFARIRFPGSNFLFSMFLATIFIPTMVVLIPNRNTVKEIDLFFNEDFPQIQDDWGITAAREAIGNPIYEALEFAGIDGFLGVGSLFRVDGPLHWAWMDSWPALVVPFLASTFSIFLLRQFFMQIPEDLWDAARIDGAGHFRFLFQVVVPVSRAAIVTTVIFTFIGTWNALEWPLLVTFTDNWRPISYGLFAFTTEAGSDLNLLMAGSVITLIPVLLVYLFAQKQFTEGIATTGLKG